MSTNEYIPDVALHILAMYMLTKPGLLDGIFSYQKSQFGYILEGLGMQNVGIFYDKWNILQPFGIFYCPLEYFTALW
jgi:hypothetical protein